MDVVLFHLFLLGNMCTLSLLHNIGWHKTCHCKSSCYLVQVYHRWRNCWKNVLLSQLQEAKKSSRTQARTSLQIFHRIGVDMHAHRYWRWSHNVGFTKCWLLSQKQGILAENTFFIYVSSDPTHFLTYLSHLPFALFSSNTIYNVINLNHTINVYYNLWSLMF